MIKKEFIEKISRKSGLTKKNSEKAFTAMISVITDALKAGEEIRIMGFGVFQARTIKERQVRSPITGESVTVPSKKYPAFRAGKLLKDFLNE